MIKEAIIKLSKKQDLTYDEAEAVMNEIMDGAATPVQMASYLTALSMKGETIDEITASAAGMRAHCIKLLHDMDVLEIVGTGGDGANSFNISTTSSLVIAAGGVPVAKHGNRAASSKSGAADVLEALGVKITILPEKSAEILKKINICFLFAQNYHIAMKYVAPIRKELGIRTVFNILGPLSNPAGASAISCLTEPFYFMGSDIYLREITETVDIPVLRKDFTVDKYMIYQAKAFGASAVLLICAILDDKELKEYRELAEDLGMDALVEAHDEEEVARALKAGAKIVGVNNRDLKTFKVDMNNSIRLRNLAPDNVVFVSESGIKNAGDIAILERNRVGAVLIGETLMRSPDKKAALEELNGGALR